MLLLPPSPVISSPSDTQEDRKREKKLLKGDGGKEEMAKSYDGENARSSVNYSILCFHLIHKFSTCRLICYAFAIVSMFNLSSKFSHYFISLTIE
jgi:hypothetical protein